jgi:hypothetical protein
MNKYCKHCETIKSNIEFPKLRSVCHECYKNILKLKNDLYYNSHKEEFKKRYLKNKIKKEIINLNQNLNHSDFQLIQVLN